jgi:hypothetical protein
MTVRAKFYVTQINHIYNGGGTEIVQVKMAPIFEGKDGVDGNTNENRMFSKYSPSGSFELMITNPDAFQQFEIGKNYYFDISPAN